MVKGFGMALGSGAAIVLRRKFSARAFWRVYDTMCLWTHSLVTMRSSFLFFSFFIYSYYCVVHCCDNVTGLCTVSLHGSTIHRYVLGLSWDTNVDLSEWFHRCEVKGSEFVGCPSFKLMPSTMCVGELCRYLINADVGDDDRRHVVRVAIGNGMIESCVWLVWFRCVHLNSS